MYWTCPGALFRSGCATTTGRYSPLNANSLLNQDPRVLGVGRPILVQVGIPKSGIAGTGALQCRMYLEPPMWFDDGRLIADWDEPALHEHTLTGYEVQYRPTGGTRDRVLHVNKDASKTRIVPPASVTTPLTNGQPHEV